MVRKTPDTSAAARLSGQGTHLDIAAGSESTWLECRDLTNDASKLADKQIINAR